MAEILGLVLAAGNSERFGAANKLLATIDHRPLILHTLKSMQACDCLVIVLRPDDTSLINLLKSTQDLSKLDIVLNHNSTLGMAHSIVCGVEASVEAHAWCIIPGDMPYVNSDSVSRVVTELRANHHLVAPYFAGKRGHPVGFGRQHLPQLLALHGDQGAKSIIEAHITDLNIITTDDAGILEDVDVPSQLKIELVNDKSA